MQHYVHFVKAVYSIHMNILIFHSLTFCIHFAIGKELYLSKKLGCFKILKEEIIALDSMSCNISVSDYSRWINLFYFKYHTIL